MNDPRPPFLVLPPPLAEGDDSRTFEDIGDDFHALALELLAALERDRLGVDEARVLRSAFSCAQQCAVQLLTLDELLHARRVRALDDRCRCGWDRGSHMVAAPHLCEEDARCPGFMLATLETRSDTDTPSPAGPTLVDALEESGPCP